MVQYKSLSMVLQLRSGEMFPLTLRSLNLPENPSIDDFRRALLNTELACHPYYAYLQRFCRFGYSTVAPQSSNGMLYIRPLRDDLRLQELLLKHQQEENYVTFYIEQTRSMKNELCTHRSKTLQGEVIPCNGSRLSNMPLILEATAFSPNSSSNFGVTNIPHPEAYRETSNEDTNLSSLEWTTPQFNGDSCSGDVPNIAEMHYSEPTFSSPCSTPVSMVSYYHLQEPYVIPCMTPLWQYNGYWVFPPVYISPQGSVDLSPNCYL